MAFDVTIKKQIKWTKGHISVVYWIKDLSTGVVKECVPLNRGILPPNSNVKDYGDRNAEAMFQSGKIIETVDVSDMAHEQIWDALEKRFTSETLTLTDTYSDWRSIYDKLPPKIKAQIIDYTSVFNVTFSFTEPKILTDLYKAEFNKHIRDFLQYVNNRKTNRKG